MAVYNDVEGWQNKQFLGAVNSHSYSATTM